MKSTRGGGGRVKRVKGVKCMMIKGDLTFGGEHIIHHVDDALEKIEYLKFM